MQYKQDITGENSPSLISFCGALYSSLLLNVLLCLAILLDSNKGVKDCPVLTVTWPASCFLKLVIKVGAFITLLRLLTWGSA